MTTITVDLTGEKHIQDYSALIYYVDLTLRDGTGLQEAITTAKEIDEQSKQSGFYQEGLD